MAIDALFNHPNVGAVPRPRAHPQPRDVEPEPGLRRARGRASSTTTARACAAASGRWSRRSCSTPRPATPRPTRPTASSRSRRSTCSTSCARSTPCRPTALHLSRRLHQRAATPATWARRSSGRRRCSATSRRTTTRRRPRPGLLGPEFGIMDASTSLKRANFVNTMTFSTASRSTAARTSCNTPNGTSIDLTELQLLAPDAGQPRRPAEPADDARHDVRRHADFDHRRRQRRLARDRHVETRAPSALSGRDLVAVPGAEVRPCRTPEGISSSGRPARPCRRCGVPGHRPAVRPGQPARDAAQRAHAQLPGARLRLPERRQRLEQHGHPDRRDALRRPTQRGPAGARHPAGRPCSPIEQPALDGPGRRSASIRTCRSFRDLYNANKLAVVTNVGPARGADDPGRVHEQRRAEAVSPSSRTPTRSRPGRPGARTSRSATGWGGRAADAVAACNAGVGGFPTITSISGSSTFCIGLKRPLSIGTGALN